MLLLAWLGAVCHVSYGKGATARCAAQGPTHKLIRRVLLPSKVNSTSGMQAWYGGLRHFLADPTSKEARQTAPNAMAAPAPAPAAGSTPAGRPQTKAPALQTVPPELRFVNGSAPPAQLPGACPSPSLVASSLAVSLCSCTLPAHALCLLQNTCIPAQLMTILSC